MLLYFQRSNDGCSIFGTAEIKLVVIISLALSPLVVTTFISEVGLAADGPQFRDALQRYWFCEQSGYNPKETCSHSHSELLHYDYSTFLVTLNVFISLLSFFALCFTVNLKYLIQKVKAFFK